ncbi:PIR protein [Plasmodium ovale]|uniref:PIR protein n=1 Tax=Plasmodium ovale TaxID=36330 RepID=A0A1C3KK02_PLAOA|nr:PIR protein [Plasmodium ovale]
MADEAILSAEIESLIFDHKLDKLNGKCTNCNSCYKYGTDLKNEFAFHILCQRLVKNIEYIHLIVRFDNENLKKKKYDDLIYWMLNIVNNMDGVTDQNEVNKVIKELIDVWSFVNSVLKSSVEDPQHLRDTATIKLPLNFANLKEQKTMSDYCQNFNTLYTKITHNKPNCKIYHDYFEKTKKVYDVIYEKCHKPDSDKSNCPNLCKNNSHHPNLILSNVNCDKIREQEKQEKFVSEEQCNREIGSLKSQLQEAILVSSNPAFNYSDPRSVFLILFTFWGIFLTLFFFSWIRNNLQKKKIVRDNFDEEIDDEPIYDYSGSLNTNMQNAEYNISYNSDWSPSQ